MILRDLIISHCFFVVIYRPSLGKHFDHHELRTAFYDVSILAQPLRDPSQPGDDDMASEDTSASQPQVQHHIVLGNQMGQEYYCSLPNVEAGSSTGDAVPQKLMTANVTSKLATLGQRGCLKKTLGWWTYEFCYGMFIKQYHLEHGKVLGDVLFLGYYGKDYNWETNEEDRKVDLKKETALHHSQYYSNGTLCDLNSQLRKTEVEFYCDGDSPTHISAVDEPASCQYLIRVKTPLLCSLPGFEPPNNKAKPSIISCQPLLSHSNYDEYLQYLEEEKRRNEVLQRKREEQKRKQMARLRLKSVSDASSRRQDKREMKRLLQQKRGQLETALKKTLKESVGEHTDIRMLSLSLFDDDDDNDEDGDDDDDSVSDHIIKDSSEEQNDLNTARRTDQTVVEDKDTKGLDGQSVSSTTTTTTTTTTSTSTSTTTTTTEEKPSDVSGTSQQPAERRSINGLSVSNNYDFDSDAKQSTASSSQPPGTGTASGKQLTEDDYKELEDSFNEVGSKLKVMEASNAALEQQLATVKEMRARIKEIHKITPKTEHIQSPDSAQHIDAEIIGLEARLADRKNELAKLKENQESIRYNMEVLKKLRKKSDKLTKTMEKLGYKKADAKSDVLHDQNGKPVGWRTATKIKPSDLSSHGSGESPVTAATTSSDTADKGKEKNKASMKDHMISEYDNLFNEAWDDLRKEGLVNEGDKLTPEQAKHIREYYKNAMEKLFDKGKSIDATSRTAANAPRTDGGGERSGAKPVTSEKDLKDIVRTVKALLDKVDDGSKEDKEDSTTTSHSVDEDELDDDSSTMDADKGSDDSEDDSKRVKVRVSELKASELSSKVANKANLQTEKLEKEVLSKLKKAGFDAKGRNVQVKIITTGYYDQDKDDFHILSEEESNTFSNMIVSILGADNDQTKEIRRQKSLEDSYKFSWNPRKRPADVIETTDAISSQPADVDSGKPVDRTDMTKEATKPIDTSGEAGQDSQDQKHSDEERSHTMGK